MDILQLLSFLLKDEKIKSIAPILDLLQKNSFNLVETLKNLNLETVAPIIKSFMQNASNSNQKENPTDFSVGNFHGLNPIANIADKDIVYALNKYFA